MLLLLFQQIKLNKVPEEIVITKEEVKNQIKKRVK